MRKSLFIGLVAVLGLIGCSRNQEIDVPDANLSIFARTESPAETKTIVESGVHVYWEPGDEIAVFTGEQSAKFTTDITAASGTATFKGTFGDATWPEDLDLWAVYPFSEDAVFDGETITTTLPSEQVAREGSFGKDMNLAIAHSSGTTLQFYNVGGGIRFSVTEEGIKKVMFEGLSGEIISGKVKIGFEEGLPVVKEVTGGSQFITLLPPDGSEMFLKDTWYYIVAIPGSFEGGYKLRFYKDSDYARKVSEKKVEIKRSIFGNIEKADEGIEYEATTTHFPETTEEWMESEQRVHYIGDHAFDIINSDDEKTKEQIKEELLGIEGVLDVIVNEGNGTIAILQQDSLWLNYIPDTQGPDLEGLAFGGGKESTPGTLSPKNYSRKNISDSKTVSSSNENNEALILAPYFGSASDEIKKYLLNAGFQEDNIHIKKDKEATVDLFKGDYLSKYKYVFIDTHGGTFYFTAPLDAGGIRVDNQTSFLTGTAFSALAVLEYKLSKDEIAVGFHDDGDYRLSMVPSFINNSDFSVTKPVVFLGACHSAELENGSGSMVEALLTNNVGAVAGYSNSINSVVNSCYTSYVLEFMSAGFSFQYASRYWKESQIMKDYCTSARYYLQSPNLWTAEDKKKLGERSETDMESSINAVDYSLYQYYPLSSDYYLINPYPQLNYLPIVNSDLSVEFRWDCELKPFVEPMSFTQFHDGTSSEYNQTITCTVEYDLFVDNKLKESVTESEDFSKEIIVDALPIGKHSWYVVGKLILDGKVEASYRTDGKDFFVYYKTPEAKDLGLSVKWGSFNLGASKPEMPGEYFAWGETETYYSRLVPSTAWKEGKEAGYDWPSYKWCNGSSSSITKYNTSALTQLEPEDDAAHVNLGDKWRIPTEDEWAELRNNCSFTWTSLNGVNGLLVTSLKPGYTNVSIFLPAAGAVGNTSLYYLGESGFYWTSGNNTSNKENAGYNTFETGSTGLGYGWIDRCYGLSIRPVYGDQMPPINGDIEGTERDPWN